jgi:hypothetical protein
LEHQENIYVQGLILSHSIHPLFTVRFRKDRRAEPRGSGEASAGGQGGCERLRTIEHPKESSVCDIRYVKEDGSILVRLETKIKEKRYPL